MQLYLGVLLILLSSQSVNLAIAPARAPARVSQIRSYQYQTLVQCQSKERNCRFLHDKCMSKSEDLAEELEIYKVKTQSENEDLKNENEYLAARVVELEKQVKGLQDMPQGHENIHETPRLIDSEASGFTAELSTSLSLSHNVPIAFDHVIYDSTNQFVPLMGTFRCPNDDYYMFIWSLHATRGRVSGKLMRDDEVIKIGPLTADRGNDDSGTSNMASIFKCKEDSLIWLKADAWPETTDCNQIEAVYSSITGFKIFGSSDESIVAITAELSRNITDSTFDVPYDVILLNEGINYTPETGSVLCPSSGVYVFVVSIHVIGISANFFLYQNGDNVRHLIWPLTITSPSIDGGTGTAVSIIQCEKNDFITVRAIGSNTHLSRYSSLSALLLAHHENETIAFQVQLKNNEEYLNGRTIMFDLIHLNIGEYYFPNAGMFICPDNELYMFSWQVMAYPESDERPAEARLMMAGEVVKRGPLTGKVLPTSTTYSSAASSQVVLQCEYQKGVYVQTVVHDNEKQSFYYRYTSFSGFRLPKV